MLATQYSVYMHILKDLVRVNYSRLLIKNSWESHSAKLINSSRSFLVHYLY